MASVKRLQGREKIDHRALYEVLKLHRAGHQKMVVLHIKTVVLCSLFGVGWSL